MPWSVAGTLVAHDSRPPTCSAVNPHPAAPQVMHGPDQVPLKVVRREVGAGCGCGCGCGEGAGQGAGARGPGRRLKGGITVPDNELAGCELAKDVAE